MGFFVLDHPEEGEVLRGDLFACKVCDKGGMQVHLFKDSPVSQREKVFVGLFRVGGVS